MDPVPSSPQRSLPQFSLWQLLLVVLGLSIVLALATQWRHIGLIVGCFLAAAAVTSWQRQWQLAAAALTALAIFVVTYLAAWHEMGYGTEMNPGRYFAIRDELRTLRAEIKRYHRETGELPDSLGDLWPGQNPGELKERDAWGQPYDYRRQEGSFEVRSLGRDGLPGGVGYDADLVAMDDPFDLREQSALPLRQFLFESVTSDGLFLTALLSSILAGSLWFVANRRSPPSGWWGASVVMTTFVATMIAMFLAWFHVALSQSGH